MLRLDRSVPIAKERHRFPDISNSNRPFAGWNLGFLRFGANMIPTIDLDAVVNIDELTFFDFTERASTCRVLNTALDVKFRSIKFHRSMKSPCRLGS